MGEGVYTIGKQQRAKSDTEAGHSKAENYALRKLEKGIRDYDYEKSYIINANGDVVAESKTQRGGKASMTVNGSVADGILTHNHPSHLLKGLAGRIGATFSERDLETMINENLKEIRAVSPNYIYSIKRPKGGWGDKKKVLKQINDLYREAENKTTQYFSTTGFRGAKKVAESTRNFEKAKETYESFQSRGTLIYTHQGIKKLANKLGWSYTRQKIK